MPRTTPRGTHQFNLVLPYNDLDRDCKDASHPAACMSSTSPSIARPASRFPDLKPPSNSYRVEKRYCWFLKEVEGEGSAGVQRALLASISRFLLTWRNPGDGIPWKWMTPDCSRDAALGEGYLVRKATFRERPERTRHWPQEQLYSWELRSQGSRCRNPCWKTQRPSPRLSLLLLSSLVGSRSSSSSETSVQAVHQQVRSGQMRASERVTYPWTNSKLQPPDYFAIQTVLIPVEAIIDVIFSSFEFDDLVACSALYTSWLYITRPYVRLEDAFSGLGLHVVFAPEVRQCFKPLASQNSQIAAIDYTKSYLDAVLDLIWAGASTLVGIDRLAFDHLLTSLLKVVSALRGMEVSIY
ncbi:hypothetical protein Hypma_004617 [Hypsizygus marmoreus]|uniref:Uncharacterized protein n=1 Tax=Hypsizygus marmoreus TaxID=39966 RepID=A0A369JXT4_HYPMA|nr:hypothetical protein Hypma_004617 [Hypsizygus marmoreus]